MRKPVCFGFPILWSVYDLWYYPYVVFCYGFFVLSDPCLVQSHLHLPDDFGSSDVRDRYVDPCQQLDQPDEEEQDCQRNGAGCDDQG